MAGEKYGIGVEKTENGWIIKIVQPPPEYDPLQTLLQPPNVTVLVAYSENEAYEIITRKFREFLKIQSDIPQIFREGFESNT